MIIIFSKLLENGVGKKKTFLRVHILQTINDSESG